MDDKSNILGSLMPKQKRHQNQRHQYDKENRTDAGKSSSNRPDRPTSGASSFGGTGGKQHKLKQRFNVIRKLGKGTYGKVQLAINKETGQEVAIKTIKKTKIENEQDLQRVRREIQIMSSIEHPHIIHIYEVFENKDKIVLVMQYAPGGELYEYVSQSKVLDDSEARRLFRQIATAIYYCHENKICHRDLKLENILLDEKNNAKLADFGLSNVFDKRRHLKTFCGSPLYASPEIVQGSPYEGPEVDCWSLGVLLYTLVYGAMPFDGTNFKRLVKQISDASYFEPKQRSQASPLIRRLLCADPAKRANILDICSDPWVNGIRGELSLGDQHSAQIHNSLLKVAQDMANLTPVRLDLLVALKPTSPIIQHEQPSLGIQEKTPLPSKPQVMESIMMEVEQNESISPVATFIVRDIGDQSKNLEQTIDRNNAPDAQRQVELEPELEIKSSSGSNPETDQLNPLDAEPTEMAAHEIEPTQLTSEPMNEELHRLANLETSGDEFSKQDSPPDVEAHMDIELQAENDTKPLEVLDQTEVELIDADFGNDTNKLNELQVEKDANSAIEDKPKKVKKKIVVVKKKRKVPKKEGDSDEVKHVEKDVTVEDKDSESVNNRQMVEETLSKRSTKSKAPPGKVRIPNTFQPSNVDELDKNQAVKTQTESRRQSTLIADVSQKLLQQLQNSNTTTVSSPARSEQAQLSVVKVADKRNEFERRASLHSPTPRGSLTGSGVTDEMGRRDEEITNKLDLSPKQSLASSKLSPRDISECQTPTGDRDNQNINQQLIECVAKLQDSLEDGGQKSPSHLEAAQRDDRSDSVETIKADPGTPSFRSSLNIELASPEIAAAPKELRSSVVGPVPITRSYKKVTFTKDGACITETGKIYSTQSEDGTVRRVERKSKVTHYPHNPDELRKTGGLARLEESQEVVENNEVEDGSSRIWHETHQFSTSSTKRPLLEKLVIPSSGMLGSRFNDQYGDDYFRRASPHTRHGSESSCSSSSTDVFEDIFDNWTGAISMFNQNRNLHQLHNSALDDTTFGESLFSQHRQRLHSRVSSSMAGTPRCESVEPPSAGGRRPRHNRSRWTALSDDSTGYESDAPTDRPASAVDGARLLHGFGNLHHFDPADMDLFGRLRSPLADIEHKHEIFKKRLADQNSKLWKGSIPSLSTVGLSVESEIDQAGCVSGAQTRRHQQGLWQYLRSQEMNTDHENTSRTSTSSERLPTRSHSVSSQQRKPPTATGIRQAIKTVSDQEQNLGLSHSSSSFLRESIPLDEAPVRRNTATGRSNDLPPAQPVRKSLSRTSLITSQLSNIHLADLTKRSSQEKQHTCAPTSFIELKRTSSFGRQEDLQGNRLESNVSGSSSAAFWNGSVSTPVTSSIENSESNNQEEKLEENLDSRVQSWLQESSSNLSNSSGSKSSVSYSTMLDQRETMDQLANIYGSLRPQRENIKSRQQRSLLEQRLLTSAGSPSSKQTVSEMKEFSTVSFSSSSCSKQNPIEITSSQNHLSKASSSTRVSKASLTFKQNTDQLSEETHNLREENEHIVCESPSIPKISPSNKILDPFKWIQNQESSSQMLGDEDSLSGTGGSADLDSSSSLLNQLRSRGYRSMINQRIVSEKEELVQSPGVASSVAESSSRIITTITSGSKTIHQKQSFQSSTNKTDDPHGDQDLDHRDSHSSPIPLPPDLEPTVGPDEETSTKPLASVLENSQRTDETTQNCSKEQEDDTIEDEDVREAKANIKAYLDRMKETELFLKSMQEEEENFEKRRQQMLIFNDLMLNTKLNGIRSMHSNTNDDIYKIETQQSAGLHSAPVQSYMFAQPELTRRNGFISSSLRPNYSRPASYHRVNVSDDSTVFRSAHVDPLESVRPLASFDQYRETPLAPLYFPATANANRDCFRRSKSQLSDQFEVSPCRRTTITSLDTMQGLNQSSIHPPSVSRRCSSQVRFPPSRYSQSSLANDFKREFGRLHLDLEPPVVSPARSPTADEATDSDDEMSSYRAATYVPKVIPQGMPARGRSFQRRSYKEPSAIEAKSQPGAYKFYPGDRSSLRSSSVSGNRERRGSLQINADDSFAKARDSSPKSKNLLRRPSSESNQSENSRLSELEQRILENKRRRTELLADSASEMQTEKATDALDRSPEIVGTSTSSSFKLTSRPSRLESMEARIKRKSYCVLMGSPETGQLRGQPSLEKWRQRSKEGAGLSSGPKWADDYSGNFRSATSGCNGLRNELPARNKSNASGLLPVD